MTDASSPERMKPLAFHSNHSIEWPEPGAIWSVEAFGDSARRYIHSVTAQTVIVSVSEETDGRIWAHLSTSYPDRLPAWRVLRDTKKLFFGPESRAIQVLPPAAEYVNIHPYCLHLFWCLSEDVLPDFRRVDASGRLGL